MKVQRTISRARIIAALGIAAIIFLLGISLGLLMDSNRIQWSEYQSKKQRTDYESLQWQYLFLSTTRDKEQTCSILGTALQKSIVDLGLSLEKIQQYRDQTQVNGDEYTLLERGYIVDNLKYWLLAKKTQEECGADMVIILYFFSEKTCDICPNQGIVLTHFKKKYEDKLLVFPINTDLVSEEQSIGSVLAAYNVTVMPTIVVDGKKYEGVVDIDNLGKIICKGFKDKSLCEE